VRSVGLVRECTKSDGNVADTLQAEKKRVSVISDALRLPARYSHHMICSYSFSPLKISRMPASAHRSAAVGRSCQITKESLNLICPTNFVVIKDVIQQSTN